MKAQSKKNKLLSAIVVVFILLPNILFFLPQKTSAQVPGVPTIVTEDISKPAIVTAKSSFIHKILGATTAGKTTISSATDLKQWAKVVLEEALRNLAKRFMQKMTESTVNWINSGFHGAPLFLERPESFFKDIAKYEIKNLVGSIGYDSTGFPFGKSFLINTINSFKSTFEQNAQYSLSKVTRDAALLDAVRNDFGVGGWDAFFINTQFPQNNYLGSQLLYTDHLAGQLQGTDAYKTGAKKVNEILAQGQGFLSPQKCETNPDYDKTMRNQFQKPTFKPKTLPPVPENCSIYVDDRVEQQLCQERNAQAQNNYQLDLGSEKLLWEKTNGCPDRPNGTSGFVSTTPGTVVADQIMDSLTSGKRQGELAIAMGNSLSAIFDALLNQLFQKGLNALSSKKTATPPADDFNYFGNTLGPSTTTGATNNFKWLPEKDFDIETGINPYKTDGTEYINWTDPNTDPSVTNQFNNDMNPRTCPTGYTGTPPNCVYTEPPTDRCPAGQTGTPPNCTDDTYLGPPQEAE